MISLRLVRLNELMRDPRAPIGVPIACAVLGAAATLIEAGWPTLLGALVGLAGGRWLVSTWRRLWRVGETPFEKLVYDFGVRGFGIVLPLGMLAVNLVRPFFEGAALPNAVDEIRIQVMMIPVLLSIGLWSGYWRGRQMAFFFGVKDDARKPPAA